MSEEELSQIYDETVTEATEAPAATETPAEPAPEVETPAEQLFYFKANGAERQVPVDQARQFASMGYDYAQKMEALKAKEAEAAAALERAGKWEQYDSFARQNPEWAQHVQEAWDNRNQLGTPEGSPAAVDPALTQELTGLKEQVAQISQFVTQTKDQAADAQYHKQYSSVAEAFPHIDLQQSDPTSGKTLEYQVLEYARNNGIQDFSVAFKAHQHEKILEHERARIRDEVIADLQKNRKAGIMGVSPTPTQPSNATDVRKMSDDELIKAAANDQELWGS